MSEFRRIPPQEAQLLRTQGAVVVDIRDLQSYAQSHIAGAHHLDNQSLPDFMARADFERPLIVACYHGNSSQGAAAYLAQQGFAEVYSLDGGFELWRATFPDEVAQGAADQPA